MAPGGGQGGASRQVFGQTMRKKSSSSSANRNSQYQRQFGGGGRRKGTGNGPNYSSSAPDDFDAAAKRRQRQIVGEEIDARFGMERFTARNQHSHNSSHHSTRSHVTHNSNVEQSRRGWLFNILPTSVSVAEDVATASVGGTERAGLDLYFSTDSGHSFKSTILYRPYFYVLPDLTGVGPEHVAIVLELLQTTLTRLGETALHGCHIVTKTDLDQPNHLAPKHQHPNGRKVLKMVCDSVQQLMQLREIVRDVVHQNQARKTSAPTFQPHNDQAYLQDPLALLLDMREYDVPYVVRTCTDLDIRAGTWYDVHLLDDPEDDFGGVRLRNPDRESKANPTFLAFDIECTKAPLKFPSADVDEIFMISYMVSTPQGGQGFLVTSRSVVAADVHDFEYTPQPNYPGPFTIFNEANEQALLERFFAEYQRWKPQIVVTYNGDFFDWPFVEARAKLYGLDLYQQTGVCRIQDEYCGRTSVHLDAFHWVQRDSYLPQGAQGLKAVTKYKLGYDPVEVDPEDMLRFAHEKPVHMATYSVSDAVATYYLYEKYVHLFIFSLSTIIPMGPEDVLRKGSGTLCEALLMVQACQKSIICPNKQVDEVAKFHKGHLLESETYIGGKVECLETGVYRSDIEYEFDLQPSAFQQLIDNVDRDLTFAIEVEGGQQRDDIVNYGEIRTQIVHELEQLRDRPQRTEKPYIYHLDVGAMYPNIILTNRLQPSAIVDDATCAACDYNQEKNGCKRPMEWVWRGDHNPATRNEYDRTKDQLAREPQRDNLSFAQLPDSEQAILVAERLKTYARKAYKRTKVTEENTRQDVVCMRENDFYVDTVRQFRDRRYEYKKLNKTWKKRVSSAKDAATKKECEDRVLVYDSLQIAHKCILNSFYGYVMRRGARWRSMEMAGIVTKTGADIITQARVLVEQIGRPLELDTDGIWCILPRSFPDVYTFQSRAGSHLKLEYPCVMLNADVHNKFTNHQYQTLVDPVRGIYETRSECSIFFEVDGPYRCMVLPASTEEGKLLKKRYAVFNFDGSLAELKGFELKRRGELELIKTFQSQVFERFLDGSSLKDCYESVAEVANHWIDVIDTRGDSLDDEELVGLISENRSMSRQLDDYGDQKGTSQTTARRLGEFLGAEIIKDKGLNCKFIIAEQPYGAPVTDRAIPTAIWKAESSVMKHFLRKWLKSPGLDGDALDIRNVLDWDYYLDRLGKSIQKIITIPAALQKIPNPVPRVEHPGWLTSKVNHLNDRFQQQSIQSAFSVQAKNPLVRINELDIEDSGPSSRESKRPVVHRMRRHRVKTLDSTVEVDAEPHAIKERVSLSKEKFGDWLAQKKKLWRKLRSQRSVPAKSDGVDRADKKARTAHTIESYVRDAALAISQKEWQIVEMREMSSFDSAVASSSGSGELVLWTMVGTDSLQKIVVTVPRTVYISTRVEAICTSSDIHSFRKVDRHLPRGRCTSYLYEVCMPEYVYRDQSWISSIEPVQHLDKAEVMLESVFESGVPLLNRALTELGSFCRVKTESQSSKGRKGYLLTDLIRVERPATKEYLHRDISFSRIFLYVRTHPRTKTGVVALYVIDNGKTLLENTTGREGTDRSSGVDISRPAEAEPGTVDVGCSCHIWIIKPGSKSAQRNVTIKQCESLFFELTQTIQEAANLDSDYACVSPKSKIKVSGLRFVDQEELAFAGANEAISAASKASSGPSLILLSSSRPAVSLRRYMSTFGSLPVVSMNFPPGPSHNPDISTLPALNWEQPAVQLCFEAYLFMYIIAFPKRVSYARYGRVPLGNLGDDENMAVYDVNFSRLIGKNRAVSWANPGLGKPDLGANFMVSEGSSVSYALDSGCHVYNQDEIWGDDDELVSPVIRRPGCYRSICVDIDVYDLAIAALTDLSSSLATGGPGLLASQANPSSPNNVALFDSSFGMSTIAGPLGDEMSTVVSLPIARALVCGWLKDAMNAQSDVADELLHHVYRLISSPQALLHDPALHRAVHGLMKTAFFRILGELQRLGCSIIYASFHRITVATNKIELADAEEYINFVIATARKRANENNEQGDSLSRVALRPRQFHTHFVFLDEYNFGSVQLERVEKSDLESENDFNIPESEHKSTVVVPSVITAWSVMNYLGSQIGHEYFRAIIGRFSKDVFKKQMELVALGDRLSLTGINDFDSQLLDHKRQMVRKHFASYLTRAVSEILKDSAEDLILPPMYTGKSSPIVPALEFIKNVTVILELDADIETEVHVLKRSLLAQIGVAEYAKAALWENPCPKYILPDVFCTECYESRDLNLCYVPPREIDNKVEKDWVCEDCGSSYDVGVIERRLISLVDRKVVRYQLQDVRCTKTNRVATRALAALSDCSAGLKLDLTPKSAKIEVTLLRSLADYHGLECLRDTTDSILSSHVVF